MLLDGMEMMEGLCQSYKHRECIILRILAFQIAAFKKSW